MESSAQRLKLTAARYADHDESSRDDREPIPRWTFRWHANPDSPFPLDLDHGDETGPWRRRGFGVESQFMHGPRSLIESSTLLLPHWVLFAVSLTFPLVALLRRTRRKDLTPPTGFCASCGYDLRATRARCPECGVIPVDARAIARARSPG